MKAKIKALFADRWWQAWSTWLLVLANFLAEAAVYLPEIEQALSADWYRWAFRVILIARIVKQSAKGSATDAG
jgi:hypothetical protein